MDCQRMLFDWAADQSALTGLVLVAFGLLYAFCGFRFIRYLVVAPTAGLGYVLGMVATSHAPQQVPAHLLPAAGVLVGAVSALVRPSVVVPVCSGATWGALGGYVAYQVDAPGMVVAITIFVLGSVGAVLAMLSRDTMIALFTTLQGAALLVLGFVAVSSSVIPSLGATFCALAGRQGLAVPILLVMLTTTGFSYQASARQGDMFTGGGKAPRL